MGATFEREGIARVNLKIVRGDLKIEDLKFNSDWNWLMEVVEKIEENYIVDVCGRAVSIHENNGEMMVDLCAFNYSTKIEAVYNACFEFIQWYSQNKN